MRLEINVGLFVIKTYRVTVYRKFSLLSQGDRGIKCSDRKRTRVEAALWFGETIAGVVVEQQASGFIPQLLRSLEFIYICICCRAGT
jgi:hypothetical protein